MAAEDTMREESFEGLRNACALEHQALSLLDSQIEHLAEYADVEVQLRSHRGETERQIGRLGTILASLNESHSSLKDVAASCGGTLAALGHTSVSGEILKNSFANVAFANIEVADYEALIITVERSGYEDAVPPLRETLAEESAMATFLGATLPIMVHSYRDRRAFGEQASH